MSPDPAGSDENQFANEIAAKYTGIVTSWLRKTISQNVVSLIDKEQLRSEILFDLIQQLRQVALEILHAKSHGGAEPTMRLNVQVEIEAACGQKKSIELICTLAKGNRE